MKKIIISSIFITFLAGCGGKNQGFETQSPLPPSDGSPRFSSPPTYSELRANIFQPKCYSCHSAGGNGGYNLSTYNGLITRVVQSNAGASELYLRVFDGSMPQGGPPLNSEELEAIEDWINSGAENN